MIVRLFLIAVLCSFTALAGPLSVQGKFKKLKVSGKDTFVAKQFLLKSKEVFAKGSDLELSFSYLDKGKGDIFVSYSSADPLDENLKIGLRFRTADGIYLTNSGKWVKHKVTLKNTDFGQDGLKFQIKVQAKGNPVSLADLDISLIQKTDLKTKRSEKLNVLMIVIDDLNDYVGAFGDPQAITPNIDKLVSQGVRFSRAYCQYPVCGPSRASFLSGLYPETSGVMDNTAYLRTVNSKAVNMFEHFNLENSVERFLNS